MAVIANEEARSRLLQSLHHALGDVVLGAMRDPRVVEVMVNPDGKIWTDRAGEGRSWTGEFMSASAAERILRTLATHAGVTVTSDQPRVSATLPETGERFQGALPPLVSAPAFAIRKRPEMIFPLSGAREGYVETGVMTANQAEAIRQAVVARKNIVVAGGTGSGKTTLLNAILAEEAFRSDRVVIIEDTRELQCSAEDCVQLLTKPAPKAVTMADLVFDVLRLRPDRIIGGEVRDGATALNLLKAWNTGHPGGCTSIHANSALEALSRFEELIGEVTARIPFRAIGQSINLIVFVERTFTGRHVKEVVQVEEHDGARYVLSAAAYDRAVSRP
jgi:type IV secretion system protein VirB11